MSNDELAAILQRIGIGGVTLAPLLAVMALGLIQLWSHRIEVDERSYICLYVQMGALTTCGALWAASEAVSATAFRPSWRGDALRFGAVASAGALLLSLLLLFYQFYELIDYVRNATGAGKVDT